MKHLVILSDAAEGPAHGVEAERGAGAAPIDLCWKERPACKEVGWVGGLREPRKQTLVWRSKPDEGICAESSFLCCDPNGGHMRAPSITAASGPSMP